eukprot:2312393-Amphidinium_carterae.1
MRIFPGIEAEDGRHPDEFRNLDDAPRYDDNRIWLAQTADRYVVWHTPHPIQLQNSWVNPAKCITVKQVLVVLEESRKSRGSQLFWLNDDFRINIKPFTLNGWSV